jgi:hypothetical protein
LSSNEAGPPAAGASAGQQLPRGAPVDLRELIEVPNAFVKRFDFWDSRYEWRRVFSELLGTFFLVLVAVGGGMVNARFGGHAIPSVALVVAPALMVMAIILFMGAVSGAHLNPAVSFAFALRGDFPWRRVPWYVVAQFAGAAAATLLLWALIGKHGSAGLTLPGHGISTLTAMLLELVLTVGLVSTILGTASGAQQVGQRRLDEPGPLARARPGARRLDVVVGLPGRAGGRRDDRGRHRVRPARSWRRDARHPGGAGDAGLTMAADADRPRDAHTGQSTRPQGQRAARRRGTGQHSAGQRAAGW